MFEKCESIGHRVLDTEPKGETGQLATVSMTDALKEAGEKLQSGKVMVKAIPDGTSFDGGLT